MTTEKEQDLRSQQLMFIGKILSTFTHEMKNYLAIIRESSGLLQDMISLGKSPRKKEGQQFLSSLEMIDGQVQRSINIINHLNGFGHRMDHSVLTFSVNDILQELLALIHRSANQKQIVLDRDFQKGLPAVRTDPLKIQFVVHSLLEGLLNQLAPHSRITTKTASSGEAVTIRIIPKGTPRDGDTQENGVHQALLENVLKNLKAEMSRIEANGEITISIPLTK